MRLGSRSRHAVNIKKLRRSAQGSRNQFFPKQFFGKRIQTGRQFGNAGKQHFISQPAQPLPDRQRHGRRPYCFPRRHAGTQGLGETRSDAKMKRITHRQDRLPALSYPWPDEQVEPVWAGLPDAAPG